MWNIDTKDWYIQKATRSYSYLQVECIGNGGTTRWNLGEEGQGMIVSNIKILHICAGGEHMDKYLNLPNNGREKLWGKVLGRVREGDDLAKVKNSHS